MSKLSKFTPVNVEDLKPSQMATFMRICARIERDDLRKHAPESKDRELKQFDVELSDYGYIFVTSVVGLVNDEGTMAEVFGRDRRMYMIGKKGALKAYDGKKWQKKHAIIYRYTS